MVDDEKSIRMTLGLLLKQEGYQCIEATTVEEAARVIKSQNVDVLITDLRVYEESGLDLIKLTHDLHPDAESLLITAHGTIESAVEAIQAGAFDYLTKPFTNQEFLLRVNKAVERITMKEEIVTLRQHVAMNYGFDNIVGISKPMLQLKETAMRVSSTDITILITGASGTGKELFARAIHHHSQRRNEPFVAVDCSAIPEALLESELFGHKKGSFTSANVNKVGLLEEADGGTVFLDELSNMPASIQVKLLRFLQESEIRPVGETQSKKVDVRVIGATNRELARLVAEGEFREDLYYRLNVIPLNLPSLTQRTEDIEILTDYFLRRISSDLDRDPLTINRAAVAKLLSHNWPGNVRELVNTLKRGAALTTRSELTPDDIMFVTAGSRPEMPTESPKRRLTIKGNLLDDNQRNLIVDALNENDWNFTKTAQELGIGRTTLWRKVKKYNLSRDNCEISDESKVTA